MLLCGFLAFAAPLDAPWWHLIAVGFGVGAGFTLDEFALWVRLEDVYWSDEGRASFDAVVCTCAFAALVVLGTRPFGLDEPRRCGAPPAPSRVVARPRPRVLRQGPRAARRDRPLRPGRRLVGALRLGAARLAVGAVALRRRRAASAPAPLRPDRPLVRAAARDRRPVAGAPTSVSRTEEEPHEDPLRRQRRGLGPRDPLAGGDRRCSRATTCASSPRAPPSGSCASGCRASTRSSARRSPWSDGEIRRWATVRHSVAGAPRELPATVRHWLGVVHEWRPDVVVTDFEPLAGLYARSAHVPLVSRRQHPHARPLPPRRRRSSAPSARTSRSPAP